jgi:hypothetical protein
VRQILYFPKKACKLVMEQKMKRDTTTDLPFHKKETHTTGRGKIILNKERLLDLLRETLAQGDLNKLKTKILGLRNSITHPKEDLAGITNIDSDGDTISRRRDILISELDQVLEAKSFERAKYYLERLEQSVHKIKTTKINDINLARWKEYDNIITDSLWILDKRDTSGAHIASYWGNFIPQIPNQLMLRYTKKGDWVLDAFVGSGTTLIECRRLGRNGIGIELNAEVARQAKELITKEPATAGVKTDVIIGDARIIDIGSILREHNINKAQLLIMHPPYHDIIKFSKDEDDLSNAPDTKTFLQMLGEAVDNAAPYLERGRYLALVIGDKYSKGEWIPLGFLSMEEVLKRDYLLKSIIVKNFDETRAKRNQKELWQYRALVGGFYIFKHEYIFLFKRK